MADLGLATVRVAVRGQGTPLLLLNGIGASIEMWRPLEAALGRTRQLIMFDAPGCGQSTPPRRPIRMAGMAELVVALLDNLGLDHVDVLGYSWGGMLAQQLVHDHPGRVRDLVLVSTTPGLGGQAPSLRVLGLMSTPMRYLSRNFMTAAAPHIYGGDQRRTAPGNGLLGTWGVQPPTVLGYAGQLFAVSGWSSLGWLHEVEHRTLVLCGDDDPLVPVGNAHLLAGRLCRAQLRLIPGGGHLWLLEHSAEGARLVESFLDTTSGRERVSLIA